MNDNDDVKSILKKTVENEEVIRKIMHKKQEFLALKDSSPEIKFSELTFCTLTANTSAEMGLRCQQCIQEIRDFTLENIKAKLVECRYRFKNTRARYIEANHHNIWMIDNILKDDNRRELLVDNFMGIGMKEASHFLRNIGYFQYSILDKHVQKFLSKYYSESIRVRNVREYKLVEQKFFKLSDDYGFEPGIMDLIVWYAMTGKIIK